MINGKYNKYPFDLIIEKSITKDKCLNICSSALGINSDTIAIVKDIGQKIKGEKDIKLICVLDKLLGEYKTRISFYPVNDKVKNQLNKISDFVALGSRFVSVLECSCMLRDDINVDDDTYDEESFILLEFNKKPVKIIYDDDLLLEDES